MRPPPGTRPITRRPGTGRRQENVVPSQLIPLAEGGQAAEGERWLLEVEALGAPPPGEAPGALAVAPLFQPRWIVGIIFAALATDVPGRPDLARAVAVIARGRSLGAMPLLPRPSLRRGAQVLVDLGAGMEPFRDDQESFVAELRRALGAGQVEVLHFADCPSRNVVAPGAAEWTAYRAPLGGVRVVLLTDLGLGIPPLGRPAPWSGAPSSTGSAQRARRASRSCRTRLSAYPACCARPRL